MPSRDVAALKEAIRELSDQVAALAARTQHHHCCCTHYYHVGYPVLPTATWSMGTAVAGGGGGGGNFTVTS